MTNPDLSLGRALKYPKPHRKARGSIKLLEREFEKNVGASLARLGLYSWHVSERNFKGIPDRYIVGGNWMELKILSYGGAREFTPMRQLEIEQQRKLDRFDRAGDRTWVGFLMQKEQGESFSYFAPWPHFRDLDLKWTPADVIARCHPYNNNVRALEEHLGEWFGKQLPGYSRW